MEKKFSIIARKNLLDKTETVVGYSAIAEEKKIVEKLVRKQNDEEKIIYRYRIVAKMPMHLLSGLSKEMVRELSGRSFHTAYAVCRNNKGKQEILYLSLLKDSALKYRLNIPDASIVIEGRQYPNPDYQVMELKLLI